MIVSDQKQQRVKIKKEILTKGHMALYESRVLLLNALKSGIFLI